ncbi:hypothetical protein AB1Y20_011709 [Prymnesium parvum]|uniref:Sulfotransferase domain-containing protein n=1 Tax=Prymnesium parvum TaxID=97485 RepID=A0AB34IJ57_PRYPA
MRRWALGCALLATLAVTARVGRRLLNHPRRAVSHDEHTSAEDVHPTPGRGVPIASLQSSTQQSNLLGPPPALLLLAPHKTGSTFFAGFLNELSKLLGLCWYTDNAAFTWKPIDHTKCSTPLCGHPPNEKEKQFTASDLGWGDCSGFVRHHLEAAATCADGLNASCQRQVSAESGFLWGPLRLPGPMRHALQLLPRQPWKWHVILHQRHPLDALISGYHSFGWRHPAAPSASVQQRREHLAKQSAVRNQTIDEYVLANAAEMHRKYLPYFELLRDPPPGVIIIRSRYEDMVTFFEHWLQGLLNALQPLYSAHRLNATHHTLMHHARAFKPDGKHKRSVLPGRFTEELQPATIAKILKQHRTWCAELGYV